MVALLGPPYIWSYFSNKGSDFYWNMGDFAHIPSKEIREDI